MMILTRLSLAASLILCPFSLQGQAPAAHETAVQGHGPVASEAPGQATREATDPSEAHGEGASASHGDAHHGPAMKLFGKEYGNLGAFLVQLLNFAVYGAGLFFLLKGALSAMFKARKEELETLLAQAGKDQAEGQAQVKEMEAKMAGLEGELAGILAKAEADSETERQRVLEAAKGEALQILAQAQAEIGLQKRLAEQELRALVAELAVQGATTRLEQKLQGPEAGKTLDRAIQQIGGVQ